MARWSMSVPGKAMTEVRDEMSGKTWFGRSAGALTTNGVLHISTASSEKPFWVGICFKNLSPGSGKPALPKAAYRMTVKISSAHMGRKGSWMVFGLRDSKRDRNVLVGYGCFGGSGAVCVMAKGLAGEPADRRNEVVFQSSGSRLNLPMEISAIYDLGRKTISVSCRDESGVRAMKNDLPFPDFQFDSLVFYALNPASKFPKEDFIDVDAIELDCIVSSNCSGGGDADGDGLPDREEGLLGTDVALADTDGDGLLDGEEVYDLKTDPLKSDTDGDGLLDGEEANTLHTDPCAEDTDGDGLSDYAEIFSLSTNPRLADSDSDGLSDKEEIDLGKTDPNDADSDDDGVPDGEENAVIGGRDSGGGKVEK